jgi:hypothetical protein
MGAAQRHWDHPVKTANVLKSGAEKQWVRCGITAYAKSTGGMDCGFVAMSHGRSLCGDWRNYAEIGGIMRDPRRKDSTAPHGLRLDDPAALRDAFFQAGTRPGADRRRGGRDIQRC